MLSKFAPLALIGCLCLAGSSGDPTGLPKPKPKGACQGAPALEAINFATDSSLVQDGCATLDSLAKLVAQGASIRLQGHTDAIGSEEYNLELSRRRAEAVKQSLLALVEDPDAVGERIKIAPFGETRPIRDNNTPDGRWANRNVIPVVAKSCSAPGKIGELLEPYRSAKRDLNFLIATVPDPLESNLSREFDLVLASIIRALELHGFQRRDTWLPWLRKKDSGDKEGASSGEPRPDPRETPGVMFFQREGNLVEAVLLVGESPVWGVRRTALMQALDIADACTPELESLQLLGPTFSGTADSLSSIIGDWSRPNAAERPTDGGADSTAPRYSRNLKMISGSATNPNLGRLGDLPGVEIRQQSTDDKAKRDLLFEHLARLGIHRLALLVESSSYGSSFQRPRSEGQEEAKVELVLPFPMHIYAIRSAHARDGETSDGNQKDHPPKNGNSLLDVDLADTDEARADLNLFDRRVTSATYDLVLSRILDVLARSRVEAVGIVATDIKDRLFLADALSRFAPNLRLFTFEADELLTHSRFARATRGMLVASSHDLSLTWKGGGDRPSDIGTSLNNDNPPHLVTRFGNDISQGVFEAVARIVRESVLSGETNLPETVGSPCHYFGPVGARKTMAAYVDPGTVRISAVGREGLHSEQIRLHEVDRAHCWLCMIPRGSIWVWLLMTSLLVGLLVWNASIRSPAEEADEGRWGRCGAMLYDVISYRATKDDQRRKRLYRLQAMGLSLLALVGLAYTVLGAPVLARLLADNADLRTLATAAIPLTTAVAVILFLSRDLARLAAPSCKEEASAKTGSANTAKAAKWPDWQKVSAYLIFLLLTAFYAGLGWIAFQESDRALDLASGISPTLPLLLLLGVPGLWVTVDVLRCKAFEDRLLPLLAKNPESEKLATAGQRLTPNLSGLLRAEFIYLTLAVLILPGAFLLSYFEGSWPPRAVRGIELKASYDFGISLVLVVAVGLVLEASYRYYRAWRKLRRTARAWIEERAADQSAKRWGEANLHDAGAKTPKAEKSAEPDHSRAKPIVDVLVEHIRWLMLFATLSLVLVLVALLTYPFEPDRALALYVSALILACAVTAVGVNWQMGRDPGLNEIRGKESAFTLQRVARAAFYLAVPAAGLLAGRFPGTLDILMGWLEPVFEVFG